MDQSFCNTSRLGRSWCPAISCKASRSCASPQRRRRSRWTLYKNDDVVGHLEFTPGSNTTSDGGQFGTFIPLSPADDVQFDHGDRFKVFAPDLSPPTPDDTAAGLSVTIAARTGTIS